MDCTRSRAYYWINDVVGEISIILKESINISIEEFRALDRCSEVGKIWLVIQRPTPASPNKITWHGTEYIFYPEDFTAFRLVSRNILLQWETMSTKFLQPDQEFQVKESIFLRHYAVNR